MKKWPADGESFSKKPYKLTAAESQKFTTLFWFFRSKITIHQPPRYPGRSKLNHSQILQISHHASHLRLTFTTYSLNQSLTSRWSRPIYLSLRSPRSYPTTNTSWGNSSETGVYSDYWWANHGIHFKREFYTDFKKRWRSQVSGSSILISKKDGLLTGYIVWTISEANCGYYNDFTMIIV